MFCSNKILTEEKSENADYCKLLSDKPLVGRYTSKS